VQVHHLVDVLRIYVRAVDPLAAAVREGNSRYGQAAQRVAADTSTHSSGVSEQPAQACDQDKSDY
jgi:hypothetical protein